MILMIMMGTKKSTGHAPIITDIGFSGNKSVTIFKETERYEHKIAVNLRKKLL